MVSKNKNWIIMNANKIKIKYDDQYVLIITRYNLLNISIKDELSFNASKCILLPNWNNRLIKVIISYVGH